MGHIDTENEVISSNEIGEGLGKKVLKGSALQFFGRFSFRILKFARTIVVAKVLFPHDVGLFALASLCLGFADIFAQTGFQSALIERSELERRHLDGAWTVHVIKGAFLGGLSFIFAPYLAGFFNESQLTEVLRVLSMILVLDGFVNVGAVLFQKNLQFGKKLIYDFSYIVTEIVAVIIAAQFIPNVWALVIGALCGQCASLIFSYVFHEYRPRLTLNFSGARELFRFGKWISLAAIVTFFISKSDGIAISKFLGVEEFGYYQLAFSLALLPGFEIVRSLGSVFFPLFARLKENRTELQASFVRLARVVLLIVAPATVGLYVIAEPLVVQLYGERWLPMIPIFNVLILYGGLKSVEYFLTPLVLGTGNPRILTYGTGIHAVVLGALIVPLTERYGVEGTAYSLVAAALVSTVYFGIRSYPIVAPTLGQGISIVIVPVLATICMYLGMEMGIERFGNHVPLSLGMGVTLYALGVAVFDLCTGKHIRTSLIWMKRTMYVR